VQVRENIGYLPENVPLYQEMKVRRVPRFPRPAPQDAPRGATPADRLRGRSLLAARCETARDRAPVEGVSSARRLADALLHNPPVLILDEPTVGLDPAQIRETRKLIRDLGGDHTVMLSTHILPEVEQVCDRAIIIAGGRIVAQGSPDELRASRRMQARVLVECKGPPDAIESALSRVSGVSEVQIVSNGDSSKYVVAAVRPKEAYDVREEVSRTVMSHGWPLREIDWSTQRSKSSSSR
jgi:ABC-2 type transport system ATP-binding protein